MPVRFFYRLNKDDPKKYLDSIKDKLNNWKPIDIKNIVIQDTIYRSSNLKFTNVDKRIWWFYVEIWKKYDISVSTSCLQPRGQ